MPVNIMLVWYAYNVTCLKVISNGQADESMFLLLGTQRL